MSIVERVLPVFHRQDSFFDRLFAGMMDRDELALLDDQHRIRSRMFHLLPYCDHDVTATNMEVQHPIIEEKGQTKLHLKFNVSDFKPEEVKIKVVGENMLEVHAEHHEKTDQGEQHRVYMRHYQLPSGFDSSGLTSELTKDGVLTIEGPAAPLKPSERLVPIKFSE